MPSDRSTPPPGATQDNDSKPSRIIHDVLPPNKKHRDPVGTFPGWTGGGDAPFQGLAYGSVLRNGIYGIVNAKYERAIGLGTPTDKAYPVCCVPSDLDIPSLKWEVRLISEGNYYLTHVKSGVRADTEPAATANSPVLGKQELHDENCRWTIRQLPLLAGVYTVEANPPRSAGSSLLCWHIGNGETNTPVTINGYNEFEGPAPTAFHWHFVLLGPDVFPLFTFPHGFVCQERMSYIRSALPSSMSVNADFTMLAWVKRHESSRWGTLVSFDSSQCSTSLFSLLLPPTGTASGPRVQYSSGYGTEDMHIVDTKRKLPPVNVWFHLAVVSKAQATGGLAIGIFVNGRLESSLVTGQIYETKNVRMILGWYRIAETACGQWSGAISNFEFYQAVLSESDIERHKDSVFLPEPTDQIHALHEHCDGGSSRCPTPIPDEPPEIVSATGPIQTNNYQIVNVGTSGAFAMFERAGNGVSIKGSTDARALAVQWKVENKKDRYIITSRLYGLNGPYTTDSPKVGDAVVTTANSKYEWIIQESSTPGEYLIHPPNGSTLSWGLASPTEVVRLADANDQHALWNFRYI